MDGCTFRPFPAFVEVPRSIKQDSKITIHRAGKHTNKQSNVLTFNLQKSQMVTLENGTHNQYPLLLRKSNDLTEEIIMLGCCNNT